MIDIKKGGYLIPCNVDLETYERVKQLASAEGVKTADIARQALGHWLRYMAPRGYRGTTVCRGGTR
jgi:hypothetical protein